MPKNDAAQPLSPFDRFTELARRIVSVPKAEVDAARKGEQGMKGKTRKG